MKSSNPLIVETLNEAQYIWHEFYAKYKACLPSPVPPKVVSTSEQSQKEYDKKEEAAALVLQRWWRRRLIYNLVPIHGDNYSPELRHLVHDQKVNMSLSPWRLKLLEEALVAGDWDAGILKTEKHIYQAMALFNAGKITQQQMYTLLERHQIMFDKEGGYKLKKTHKILGKDGEFTQDAKEILLPVLSHLLNSDEKIESFKLLIEALPLSEQMFYTMSVGNNNPHSDRHLTGLLVQGKAIHYKDDQFIQISSGGHDSANLVSVGIDEYIRLMLKLGTLKMGEIEEGIKNHARYGAISYPGSPSYPVHGYKTTGMESTAHDRYHSLLMTRIPNNIIYAFQHMVELCRGLSPEIEWSKEIWEWTDLAVEFYGYIEQVPLAQKYIEQYEKMKEENGDLELVDFAIDNIQDSKLITQVLQIYDRNSEYTGDFLDLFHKPASKLTPEELTTIFCHFITFGFHSSKDYTQGSYLFTYKKNITLVGSLVLLDMYFNPNTWKSFNIDTGHLLGDSPDSNMSPMKYFLDLIHSIEPNLKNQDQKIQLLECYLFFQLCSQDPENIPFHIEKINELHEIILENKGEFLEKLKFSKLKSQNQDENNTLILTYGGENCMKWDIDTFKKEISKPAQAENHKSKKPRKSSLSSGNGFFSNDTGETSSSTRTLQSKNSFSS
ncbi:Uncharacterised protein [Legionella wadsworthii]|uniref:Uncharacterized protein n=1 Tax=Legionella wadsworthii TaxID=28088 RepID=A0A378LNG8_9GAMM|nr:hypothetical protein [Legionella wadsworthii]STY28303.1 Uncharacterised protein [Legionella wadsworthii]